LPCKQRKWENLITGGYHACTLRTKAEAGQNGPDHAISGDMHFWCTSCSHGAFLSPPAYERIEYWYVFIPVLAFLCSHAD